MERSPPRSTPYRQMLALSAASLMVILAAPTAAPDATDVLDMENLCSAVASPAGASSGGAADVVLREGACATMSVAMSGCNNYHGEGFGNFEINGHSHSAEGSWTDGCGGKRCDDDVTGTFAESHWPSTWEGWFQFIEHGENGWCAVYWNVNGNTGKYYYGEDWHVQPKKAGSDRWVEFTVEGWRGSLFRSTSTDI